MIQLVMYEMILDKNEPLNIFFKCSGVKGMFRQKKGVNFMPFKANNVLRINPASAPFCQLL